MTGFDNILAKSLQKRSSNLTSQTMKTKCNLVVNLGPEPTRAIDNSSAVLSVYTVFCDLLIVVAHSNFVSQNLQNGPKSRLLYWVFVTTSIMHQFKEIPMLERLLNFQKDVFY